MTKPTTKYHRVHYRRIESNDGEPTFEQLCREALNRRDSSGTALWLRPNDRIMSFETPDGQRQILMNRVADLSSAVFGEICGANDRDLQALLRRSTRQVQLSDLTIAEVFDLSETHPPDGSIFIRGTGYWLAMGNHLFFVQLGTLSARHLQDYLAWLIADVANQLGHPRPSSSFLVEIDVSEVGEQGIGDIKNLHIKGNSRLGVRVPVRESGGAKTRRYSRQVRKDHQESERAMPIVEAVLGPLKTKRLVDSLGPDEYITAEADVRVVGSRTEVSREVIREIAHQIADETDAEVTIEGKNGRIRGGDAILRMNLPFEVPNEGGSLLDFDNVADQLQEVYRRFVTDGKIKA